MMRPYVNKKKDGTSFVKVITTLASFPVSKSTPAQRTWPVILPEKITEGLDGLRDRLAEYFQMGARLPSGARDYHRRWHSQPGLYEANAHALARYAALCQEAGMVPVVEPEVLMDGGHTLDRCYDVRRKSCKRFSANSISNE